MRPYVVRLRRRDSIHTASDFAVVVLQGDISHRDAPNIPRHLVDPQARVCQRTINVDDARYIFGPQEVLLLALAAVAVCIDEHHMFTLHRPLLVHHQHPGRNAGTIELPQEPDDRFQRVHSEALRKKTLLPYIDLVL